MGPFRITAARVFLTLLRDEKPTPVMNDEKIDNFALRSVDRLRAPKNELGNEREGQEILNMSFGPVRATKVNHLPILRW
jgi:hypothetical protein